MNKWDDLKYQTIIEVKNKNDVFEIFFEDGAVARIQSHSVLPPSVRTIDLAKMSFNSYEVLVPSDQGVIEIPWTKIRLVSDEEFNAHMAKSAEQEARKIGSRIKTLREKRNLKSKNVAARAGITPQSLSRIESGKHEIGFATLQKILTVMGYELSDLVDDDQEFGKKSFSILLKKLSNCGIDKTFALKKLIPHWVQTALEESKEREPEMLLNEAAKSVCDVFGWSVAEFWTNESLSIDRRPALGALFKTPAGIDEKRAYTYSAYAYKTAQTTLMAIDVPIKKYPEEIEEIRTELFSDNTFPTFETLLSYIWSLGICVIPLTDPGLFHGASWNINGRHCIVLKQRTRFHARWIYDLLHEFRHVLGHLDNENTGIIESGEISPFSGRESREEREANSFASNLIFDGRAEQLAQKCTQVAEGKIEYLKNAVIKVAKEGNVGEDFLANYIAFRLSHQDENWWGTANNLQIDTPPPLTIARELLTKNIDFKTLSDDERGLLERALKD